MKKRLLLISCIALSFAACNKNELVPASQTRLDAILAEDPVEETKTAIGEKTEQGYPVVWSEGDCISVNSCPSLPLAAGDFSGNKASFTIKGVVTSPFKAVYPLSAATWSDGACTVTLPATQNYVAGSFDPAASVMLSNGTSLIFQNVLSYLKLNVVKGETDALIRSIKVAGNNGEALSGTFDAVFGDVCSIDAEGNGEAVTVNCGEEGVALGTPVIIALPAKNYAGGLNITVTTVDGKVQKVTSSKEFNAAAGKIYTTSFTYSETPAAEPEIATEADLIAFLKDADGGVECSNFSASIAKDNANFGDYSKWVASDGKVHITADITLTKTVDWSETVSGRSCTVSNFDGIIDGGGHTITFAGAVKAPMFTNLYGTISDLKFAGNPMTVTHSPFLGAPFVCVVQKGGLIQKCTNTIDVTFNNSENTSWKNLYISGIAVRSFGTIQDCVNEGKIEASGVIESNAYVCGICPIVYAGAKVVSCTNRGSIVSTIKKTSDTSKEVAKVGGVASWVYGSLENCINEAEIAFSGKLGFGGVAFCNDGGTFSGCRNTGALSVDTDQSRLGGIVYINNGGTLTSCVNTGTLTCPNSKCEIAGIAVCSKGTGAMIDHCDNNGAISVTGSGTRAGGICFNMNAGTVLDCNNTADITFATVPKEAGEVQFIGGIVGIASEVDLTGTEVAKVFSNDDYVIPTTDYAENTLSSKLLISGCTNTGILKMTVTPEASTAFVRNVAIGGILGWNWAVATAKNYVEILNCTNGVASAGTDYYYVQYVQEKNNPTYLSPALGGILGQSAPYNSSQTSKWSIAPFTKGFKSDSARDGMKIVIDGCKSYGVVSNTASYSSSPTTPSTRAIRGIGGIAGMIYGGSDASLAAQIRNCAVNAYVLVGLTSSSNKQSVENCAGGIAGAAAWCDVDNCTVNSPVSGRGVGSSDRHAMAAGGVFGSVTERYSVTNCTLNMSIGFKCTKTAYWGLVSGGSNYATRDQGYASIKGSVISGNKFNPGPVKINGTEQNITSENFTDYLISSKDKADNDTNAWLTMSNNTWTGN